MCIIYGSWLKDRPHESRGRSALFWGQARIPSDLLCSSNCISLDRKFTNRKSRLAFQLSIVKYAPSMRCLHLASFLSFLYACRSNRLLRTLAFLYSLYGDSPLRESVAFSSLLRRISLFYLFFHLPFFQQLFAHDYANAVVIVLGMYFPIFFPI